METTKQIKDLTNEQIDKIFNENFEYLTWLDGSQISNDELKYQFLLTLVDGIYALQHLKSPFVIEDIICDINI
jgi:hypothetical protein